jgi:hypothetical protein
MQEAVLHDNFVKFPLELMNKLREVYEKWIEINPPHYYNLEHPKYTFEENIMLRTMESYRVDKLLHDLEVNSEIANSHVENVESKESDNDENDDESNEFIYNFHKICHEMNQIRFVFDKRDDCDKIEL